MVSYWRHQIFYDLFTAVTIAVVVTFVPHIGGPVILRVEQADIVTVARAWVAPSLTLLGMLSATVAFAFAMIDRHEFRFLKSFGAEKQLWTVFGENIAFLGLAAVFASVVSLLQPEAVSTTLRFVATFFMTIVAIGVLKFCWLMCQIISVRISQAGR